LPCSFPNGTPKSVSQVSPRRALVTVEAIGDRQFPHRVLIELDRMPPQGFLGLAPELSGLQGLQRVVNHLTDRAAALGRERRSPRSCLFGHPHCRRHGPQHTLLHAQAHTRADQAVTPPAPGCDPTAVPAAACHAEPRGWGSRVRRAAAGPTVVRGGHRVAGFRRDVVVGVRVGERGLEREAPGRERVRDVLEEDQAEYDVLLLRRLQDSAQLVGGVPERRLQRLHRLAAGLACPATSPPSVALRGPEPTDVRLTPCQPSLAAT